MSYHYTEPSPLDLHHALGKASVGERAEMETKLVGLPVCWKAAFFDARPDAYGPGRAQLSLTSWSAVSHVDVMLFAAIDLAQYPQLAGVHRGRKMVVTGSITKLEEFTINLDLQRLELLPEHFWDTWGNV